MWDERSTTRDREPVLLRDVLAATTAALHQASREAEAVAAAATAPATASAAEAMMPGPRCGECGAETRRAARAIPGRRPRTGPGAAAAGACPNRSAA
ncbi:hypothetical protein [Streptomyces sp. NPDC056600]|uniref:hypothetical protein n=1 Tax=Streptomyces sp. NPDC056600 TaxID=3345874 RepID=UPI0036B31F7A